MSAPAVTERALVLRIAPSGESFHQNRHPHSRRAAPFSASSALSKATARRVPQHPISSIPPTYNLETSKQGTARFVNDYRLVHRRSSYRPVLPQAATRLRLSARSSRTTARTWPTPPRSTTSPSAHSDAFAERARAKLSCSSRRSTYSSKTKATPCAKPGGRSFPTNLREAGKQLINPAHPRHAPNQNDSKRAPRSAATSATGSAARPTSCCQAVYSRSVLPAAFLIHCASGRMPLLFFSLLITRIVACDPCSAPLRIIICLNVSTSLRHQIQEKMRVVNRQQSVCQ